MADSNSDGLNGAKSLLEPQAKIITSTYQSYNISIENKMKIDKDEKESLLRFDVEHTKYLVFGLLSFLALVFDFWVSRETMKPLAQITKLKPEVVALLFNLLDALIAIYASGILAKGIISIEKAKRVGGAFLWSLCGVKIILFVVYGKIIVSGHISIVGMVIIIALAILIYAILHFTGSGLLYILTRFKYWIIKTWADDPNTLKNNNRKAWVELDQKCNKFGVTLTDAERVFGINNMKIQ